MSESLRILVIEDDPSISEVVCAHLTRQGHCCVGAFSGTEGMLHLEHGDGSVAFDLVITDLMLPGMTGEDVVGRIRAASATLPIIVISARITPADKVMLLTLGADDYLTKPFDLDELTARVNVQMRHRRRAAGEDAAAPGPAGSEGFAALGPAGSEGVAARAGDRSPATLGAAAPDIPVPANSRLSLRFRDWELDPDGHTFAVAGEPVALTRTEFNILELLMARPQKVFTKQELFELAWGEPYSVEDSTVNVHISNLRRKLKPTGTDGYLQTVWGLGYKLSLD